VQINVKTKARTALERGRESMGFRAGLLYLLRFERVDNLGAYRIPPEIGLLILI
jgi:hypothetical protein